jgi:hypothetical protein
MVLVVIQVTLSFAIYDDDNFLSFVIDHFNIDEFMSFNDLEKLQKINFCKIWKNWKLKLN